MTITNKWAKSFPKIWYWKSTLTFSKWYAYYTLTFSVKGALQGPEKVIGLRWYVLPLGTKRVAFLEEQASFQASSNA